MLPDLARLRPLVHPERQFEPHRRDAAALRDEDGLARWDRTTGTTSWSLAPLVNAPLTPEAPVDRPARSLPTRESLGLLGPRPEVDPAVLSKRFLGPHPHSRGEPEPHGPRGRHLDLRTFSGRGAPRVGEEGVRWRAGQAPPPEGPVDRGVAEVRAESRAVSPVGSSAPTAERDDPRRRGDEAERGRCSAGARAWLPAPHDLHREGTTTVFREPRRVGR